VITAAVLADTHVRDSGSLSLPAHAWDVVEACDVILHAGDLVEPAFLARLRGVAPVRAVRGNNDATLSDLPETERFRLDDVRVAMIHDSGARRGREQRMHRRFPDADLVVFGHSHIPWDAAGIDGQWLFNPGSATLRRRQPHRTMGVVRVAGTSLSTELVALD
jgi:putative phosphoesterase